MHHSDCQSCLLWAGAELQPCACHILERAHPAQHDAAAVGAAESESEAAGSGINDDQCAICDGRGDLLCCDACPRAFHLSCCGVKPWRRCSNSVGARCFTADERWHTVTVQAVK